MTTLQIEPGTSATYGFDLFRSTSGTVGSSAECSIMGPRTIKITAGAGGHLNLLSNGLCGAAGRLCFHMAGPDSSSNQILETASLTIGTLSNTSPNFYFFFYITAGGVPRVAASGFDASGTISVKNKTTPQHYCIVWNVTSATNFTIKVFINGVLDLNLTQANGSLFTGGGAITKLISDTSNSHTTNWYFSDIYFDNDSSLTYPGDIYVTAKLPSKLNTNNFDTLGGSGTNRYDRVGERPLSQTNYIQHAATSDVQENFAIQGELEGDANLCGARIIARAAWVVAKKYGVVAGNVNFVNNDKTTGTTISSAFGGLEVGMTVLLAFAMDGATGTVSCTDNASPPNTYVVDVDKAAASPSTSNVRVCIIRGYIASTTSLTSITITHPSVAARAVCGKAFHGIYETTPLDKSTSAVGTAANPSTGATASTTQANEVVFGALAYEGVFGDVTAASGMTPTATRVGPFSSCSTSGGGGASNVTAEASYAFQTATNTQTASWTAGAADWACAIATYKSVGADAGTSKIMNNGTETALTLTNTAATYTNIVDGGEYPANPAAVGMRSSNNEQDNFMYECGMLVAYIPGPPTHHHHKWGPTFNPVLAQ